MPKKDLKFRTFKKYEIRQIPNNDNPIQRLYPKDQLDANPTISDIIETIESSTNK